MTRYWPKALSCLVILAVLGGACGTTNDYTQISATQPVVQTSGGFALSANPTTLTEDFGVKIDSVTAETFAQETWATARAALPANLRLLTNIFSIATSGTSPKQLFLSVVIPPNYDLAHLDLYAWDGTDWSFLPAHPRGNQMVATVTSAPLALGLFEAQATPPLAFTTLEPGQALTAAASGSVNAILLGGVFIQPNGALAGQLPGTPQGQNLALYPVIRNYDAATGQVNVNDFANLLSDPGTRANHLQGLVSFATSENYAGLVLDYRGVDENLGPLFTRLVTDLSEQLHAQNKTLLVRVMPATAQADNFNTAGYEWPALSAAADALLLPIADNPQAYGDGSADQLLAWAVGEVNRGRLRLLTSALSVDKTAAGFTLRDHQSLVANVQSVQIAAGASDKPALGEPVTVTLAGQNQSVNYDAHAFAATYTFKDEAGTEHLLWITSADTLRQRFALASRYRLGGVVVADLLTIGVPAEIANAIAQYKANLTSETQTQTGLLWKVSDASGVVAQATAQPDHPFIYVASKAGDYQISAELQGSQPLSFGSVPIKVAEVTATPRASTGGGGGTGTGTVTRTTSSGGGGFVPPPPVAGGPFELGGQVPGFIGHPAEMKLAGMNWVKVQAFGDVSGLIGEAHGQGFKVLVSALGDINRAADPAYWPEYAGFVAGIAASGADAIEVWNEANIDREWPNGQISGATYTQMLQQAYSAIKAANSGTIVISGAPAPTGAAGAAGCTPAFCNDDTFLQQMANAGAANYMDCVGVHYNTGTTSPNATDGSALGGYHYSFYFWPMVNLYYSTFGGSRPLCFTELGYLTPSGYEHIPLPAYFQWAQNTTISQQAQWLADSVSLGANSGKVRLIIVFNMDFTQYLANDPQAGYALIRPDGSCPACAALDAVMP